MPKKANKKSSKKEDSEDEYEPVDEGELLDEDLEEFDEDMEDEEDDSDEEKDIIEPDVDNNECMIDEAIEDDNEYFENNEETEVPAETSAEFVSKENRVSCNRLTKYEMVRILGERTKQLNMGAKPMIKNHAGLSYDTIAVEELKLNMVPFKIKRPLQNGKFEIWTLDELYKDHLLAQLE